VTAQYIGLTLAALFRQPDVQAISRRKFWDRPYEVAPRRFNQALNSVPDHAKVCFGMIRDMCQRHKHCAASSAVFADLSPGCCLVSLDPELVPKPLLNTFGGLQLPVVPAGVVQC
jgi:hypothetical protein